MRVLLVEDDTRIARIVMRALKERGADVMWVAELRTAGHITSTPWSAALVDLGLPEGPTAGLTLLRDLSRDFPNRPRAAFTGTTDPAIEGELRELRCDVIRKSESFEDALVSFLRDVPLD